MVFNQMTQKFEQQKVVKDDTVLELGGSDACQVNTWTISISTPLIWFITLSQGDSGGPLIKYVRVKKNKGQSKLKAFLVGK